MCAACHINAMATTACIFPMEVRRAPDCRRLLRRLLLLLLLLAGFQLLGSAPAVQARGAKRRGPQAGSSTKGAAGPRGRASIPPPTTAAAADQLVTESLAAVAVGGGGQAAPNATAQLGLLRAAHAALAGGGGLGSPEQRLALLGEAAKLARRLKQVPAPAGLLRGPTSLTRRWPLPPCSTARRSATTRRCSGSVDRWADVATKPVE